MIRIFIESGVNQAEKSGKETTDEKDFVEKFIQHHFPKYKLSKDYEVFGTGGKDKLHKFQTILQENTFNGGINLVIYDADSHHNGGGYSKRKIHYNTHKKTLDIEFDLFLWANNHSDGDFETMLMQIILPKHKGLIDSFNQYAKRIRRMSRGKIKYKIPGNKGCIHSYISAMPMKRKEKELFAKGYWGFENKDYWNLDSEYLLPLKKFLGRYF